MNLALPQAHRPDEAARQVEVLRKINPELADQLAQQLSKIDDDGK